MNNTTPKPQVMLVGGPDVDARIDIMRRLTKFQVSAVGSSSEIAAKFERANLAYYQYPLARHINPIVDIQSTACLVRLFRRMSPQIVHTYDTKPGIWARLAARCAGIPIVIGTLPGLGSLYSSNTLKIRAIRTIYQPLQKAGCHFSDVTIFQNHMDRDQFVEANLVEEKKATVILGSGVSTGFFDKSLVTERARKHTRAELGLQETDTVVTMIARVMVSKGVTEFGQAAKDIQTRYPDVKFLLVGGLDESSLDRLNDSQFMNLRQNVLWVGQKSNIREILAVSDICVLPSYVREGIPRVLLEAASMELPLVTTDSPGCNEIVKHGSNGYYVAPRDHRTLVDAIEKLLADPSLRVRFGKKSRRRAVEHFDLDHVVQQTENLYFQLIERYKIKIAAPTLKSVQHF